MQLSDSEGPFTHSLECENVETIESHGTLFYACEEDLTPRVEETIQLLGRVKEYEQDVLGMHATGNYRQYASQSHEASAPAISYRLYVAPKFKLGLAPEFIAIPERREYRALVEKPVMLYSNPGPLVDDLADEELFFRENGYDTYRRVMTDFSSPGETIQGANITPGFVGSSPEWQIITEIHEGYHYNDRLFWGHGDRFEGLKESIVTMEGYAGAIDFIKLEYGEGSETYAKTLKKLADWSEFAYLMNKSYAILSNLYVQDITSGEMESRKQEILAGLNAQASALDYRPEAPLNNAVIEGYIPYTRLFPIVYRVYQSHPDIREFAEIMRAVPDAEQEGIDYLEQQAGGVLQ